MRRFLAHAMVVVVAIAGITWMTAASTAPASAAAACTGLSAYFNNLNHEAAVPSIRQDTHKIDCQLGPNNNNRAVEWLKINLNRCYGQHLPITGVYGPPTRAAVAHAQTVEHITVDGIYGPQTRDHIKWESINFATCARLAEPKRPIAKVTLG